MYKIAVIGRPETVIGFKALGLETFSAADAAEACEALDFLTEEGSQYAIIYIEESFAEKLCKNIERYKDSPTPAIIVIPGRDGSTGMGLSALNSAVERAVGINILDKE
ncbi:MAG: V-type ATP synthase subunit F [Eubacteriales bacterium]|nr:V-type ATP synthase subunit F [Eubacteriales bacterium]